MTTHDPFVRAALAAPLVPGARVLLAGNADALADALRARGAEVACVAAAAAPAQPPASADLIVARGALEHERWDRWWLQRLHAVLRPGGRLVLEVPHLLDLSTFAGASDLAARALRQSLRRGATGPAPFHTRRYTRARLAPVFAQLRYALERVTPAGAAPWSALGPGADGFASRLVFEARALPTLYGPPPSDWPPAERVRAYDRAGFDAVRAPWATQHAATFAGERRECDAASYAGAEVLVLAPHPDDEVIGAGGTLLRLAAAGARITCVQATDGSAGAALDLLPEHERVQVRVAEACAVGEAAGFAETRCWREDNRAFRASAARVAELREFLHTRRPKLVFVPFVTEAHADHITLERMLADAVRGADGLPEDCEVWCYEVWSLVPANRYSDITAEMPRVAGLLGLYEMAMRIDDFVHFCADRALDHHREWRGRDGYAEAFFAVPLARFPALLATAQEAR